MRHVQLGFHVKSSIVINVDKLDQTPAGIYDGGVTHSHLRRRGVCSRTIRQASLQLNRRCQPERSSRLSLSSCPQALYLYTLTRGQLTTRQYEVPYLREQAVVFSPISHLSFPSHF